MEQYRYKDGTLGKKRMTGDKTGLTFWFGRGRLKEYVWEHRLDWIA